MVKVDIIGTLEKLKVCGELIKYEDEHGLSPLVNSTTGRNYVQTPKQGIEALICSLCWVYRSALGHPQAGRRCRRQWNLDSKTAASITDVPDVR